MSPVLLVALAALLLASYAALRSVRDPVGAYHPKAPDPAYATQIGGRGEVRKAHLQNLTEELTDSTYEICEVRTVRQWSKIVGSAPNPDAVAQRYAAVNYPPAERPGARAGCKNALIDQLAVRGSP